VFGSALRSVLADAKLGPSSLGDGPLRISISLWFASAAFCASSILAETNGKGVPTTNLLNLRELCSVVYERTRAAEESGFRWEFERIIYEAAGANEPSKLDQSNLARIQALWNNYPEHFTCASPDFDVPDGSILKYAVSSRNFSFLNYAISWKLNLNSVDQFDGRTLLDYLEQQVRDNQGSEIEPQLQEYADAVRSSGGRRSSELKGGRT
jgi:hypothetical protein